MKLLSMILVFVAAGFVANAQNGSKLPPLDKSPMDMAYYPVNYPVLRIPPNKMTEPLIARVIYSRPSKSGRKVFGELVEDGKIWRLGANEATEIEFYRDVKVGGKNIKKGRYTLYALESTAKWTLIINKDTGRNKHSVNQRHALFNATFTHAFHHIRRYIFKIHTCGDIKPEFFTEAFHFYLSKVISKFVRLF